MKSLNRTERIILGVGVLATVGAAVARYGGAPAVLAFVLAAVALAALASVVSFATEQVGERFGPAVTGFLQSTLGNLPEFFIVIFALSAGQVVVAQTSVIGSLFANALLVLGLVICTGSAVAPDGVMRFRRRLPNDTATLLLVSAFIIVVVGIAVQDDQKAGRHVDTLSAIAAIALLATYGTWAWAYLHSDTSAGGDVAVDGEPAPGGERAAGVEPPAGSKRAAGVGPAAGAAPHAASRVPFAVSVTLLATYGTWAWSYLRSDSAAGEEEPAGSGTPSQSGELAGRGEAAARGGHHAGPRVPFAVSVVLLAVSGVGAAFVSDWFIKALEPAIEAIGISQAFAGLVVVALAGNAVENVAGIVLARKGQSDLAISVVKNSVAQIAAFLFPALVLVSLLFSQTLTFALNPVYIGAILLTALAVWQITGDGEATRFEGVALIALYVVLGAYAFLE